ncbi:MAG: CoA-transferase [Thermodesulfobacteriota bacterium]
MEYTSAELMVVAAAREIRDRELVFVGMRLPLLAFLLAKEVHAKEAVSLFENGIIRDRPSREGLYTVSDPANVLAALNCTDMLTIMSLLQSGLVDLGFIGGAQIDRFGNLNTSYIKTPGGGLVRLPGSGGAGDIACLAKRLLVIMPHEKRRFVKRVDYVTSPGYGTGPGWRQEQGLVRGGPAVVITSKGIIKFDPDTREAYLHSYHPGVDLDDIQENTGWDLTVPTEVSMTEPPRPEELAVVRRYDPQGFWTG